MSIINDALKKAEQFRKWDDNHTQSKFERESNSATAVLEETPSPKIQRTVLPVRVIAQPQAVFHDKKLAQSSVETPRTSSSKSFLAVFLIGVSILTVLGLFLILSNFSITERTILQPKIQNSKSQSTIIKTTTQKISEPAPAAEQEIASNETKLAPAIQTPVSPVGKTVEAKSATDTSQLLQSLKSRYQLTGIYSLNDHERYAFINGKVVEVGGTVNGAKVIAIEKYDVTLKRGSRVFVLTMP